MVTSLQATGTPGGIRSFAPKSESATGRDGTQFTELTSWAIPGPARLFEAKSGSTTERDGTQFTELASWATPGLIRVFEAKTPAEILPPVVDVPLGGGGSKKKAEYDRHLERLMREDEEIVAIIMAAVRVLQ